MPSPLGGLIGPSSSRGRNPNSCRAPLLPGPKPVALSCPLLGKWVMANKLGIILDHVLALLPMAKMTADSPSFPLEREWTQPDDLCMILPQGLCTVLPLPGTPSQRSIRSSFKFQLLTRTCLKLHFLSHSLLYFSPSAPYYLTHCMFYPLAPLFLSARR